MFVRIKPKTPGEPPAEPFGKVAILLIVFCAMVLAVAGAWAGLAISHRT